MRISDWSSDVCSSDLVIHVVAEELIDLTRRLRDLRPEFTRADHVKHQGRDQRDPKPSPRRHPRDVTPMPKSRDFHCRKRARPLSMAGPRRVGAVEGPHQPEFDLRSEDGTVGKELVRSCKQRLSQSLSKKKQNQ